MFNRKTTLLATSVLASTLAACGGSDNKSSDKGAGLDNDGVAMNAACVEDASYNCTTIDASSTSEWAYFDLNTNQVVNATDDWDIGVRRTDIIVNQNKTTAMADLQTEKYDGDDAIAENVLNPTSVTEEGDFLAVTAIDGDVIPEGISPAINKNDVYSYQPGVGYVIAADNWHYMVSAEGDSFARFDASDITKDASNPFALGTVTLDFYLEDDSGFSETVSSSWAVDLDTTGMTCYDFDAGTSAECDSDEWDIKADITAAGRASTQAFYINGGESGDGEARVVLQSKSRATSTANPQKEPGLNNGYSADKEASAFNSHSWYVYGRLIGEDSILFPNYRTYVIDTDASSEADAPYKLQIINYYDDVNTSGYMTIRFTELTDTGE
jgi:hypothetical protein